jgi:hypothetical protein
MPPYAEQFITKYELPCCSTNYNESPDQGRFESSWEPCDKSFFVGLEGEGSQGWTRYASFSVLCNFK